MALPDNLSLSRKRFRGNVTYLILDCRNISQNSKRQTSTN